MEKLDLSLPAGTPEFMAPAYYGCLYWAIGHEPIRAQFETDTGTKPLISRPRTGIEAFVDKACGIDYVKDATEYMAKFKLWHDANIWGDIDQTLTESPTHAQ